MKRPSIFQLIWAHDVPGKLWLTLWPVMAEVVAINACEPSRALLHDIGGLISFIVVLLIAPVLGFLVSLVAGSIILAPFYELRERLNGGPFKKGDRVQILVGPHSGRITTIQSPWQGREYQVDLDEASRAAFKDIFRAANLVKHKE